MNSVNIDVNKVSFRDGSFFTRSKMVKPIRRFAPEETDLIANAAIANASHTQSGNHFFRKGYRRKIAASSLNHQPDYLAPLYIEYAAIQQKLINRRIEKSIVLNVIDMPIHIIVMPSRSDEMQVQVVAA